MNKTKTVSIILLLLVAVVIAGCNESATRHSNDPMSQHVYGKELSREAQRFQNESDSDWPPDSVWSSY